MLSPTLDEIILRLFDDASKGSASLLNSLQELVQCTSIKIVSNSSKQAAANDTLYRSDNNWFIFYEDVLKHPCIKLSDSQKDQFILVLSQEDHICLELTFENDTQLKYCLNSPDFIALIPHIQEAFTIANKISEQIGDIGSINYVISNHACRLTSVSPEKNKAVRQDFAITSKDSANSNIDLEIDRNLLQACFNLALSEAELSKLLFKGLSLQEIAEVRCVSKQTTRKQLQSVLKKTSCDSQEHLILKLFDLILTTLSRPKSDTFKKNLMD